MDGFSNSAGAGVVLTGAGGDRRPLQAKVIQLRITKVGNLHIFRSQQFDVEKSVEAFLLGLRDAVHVDIPETSFEEGGLRRFGQVDGRNTLPILFGVERGESCVSEPRIELRAPTSVSASVSTTATDSCLACMLSRRSARRRRRWARRPLPALPLAAFSRSWLTCLTSGVQSSDSSPTRPTMAALPMSATAWRTW